MASTCEDGRHTPKGRKTWCLDDAFGCSSPIHSICKISAYVYLRMMFSLSKYHPNVNQSVSKVYEWIPCGEAK